MAMTHVLPPVAARPEGRARRVVARVAFVVLAFLTACCGILAGGAVLGRWRFSQVSTKAPDVHVASDALLVLKPADFREIRPGDRIVVQLKDDPHAVLYNVQAIVSSDDGLIRVSDRYGRPVTFRLGASTWRIAYEVPAIGRAVGSIPGSFVAWTLIGAGALFVLCARFFGRRRRSSSVSA